ncbi:MAG: hypothetical protein QX199_19615 [Methylococcaceae bacterium]
MNTQPLNQAKDEDVRSVETALRRAAQKARLLAAQTDTPLVVVRDGRLLVEHIGNTGQENSNNSTPTHR